MVVGRMIPNVWLRLLWVLMLVSAQLSPVVSFATTGSRVHYTKIHHASLQVLHARLQTDDPGKSTSAAAPPQQMPPAMSPDLRDAMHVKRSSHGKRLSLKDLQVGDKLPGRVISFTKFGMYVDVGAIKDGLVHIKDTSDTYFVQNLEAKYTRGQDLDTWVKFVDLVNGKFGLQLFPVKVEATPGQKLTKSANIKSSNPNSNVARSTTSKAESYNPFGFEYGDLHETQGVYVTVIKSSAFGLFVYNNDSNSDSRLPTAYLHKRKMLINKKQLKLKTWQIHPIGSKVECYVYSIDKQRHRIQLTTYDPIEWDMLIPDEPFQKHSEDPQDEHRQDSSGFDVDGDEDDEIDQPSYSSISGSSARHDNPLQAKRHSKPGRQNTVVRGKELKEHSDAITASVLTSSDDSNIRGLLEGSDESDEDDDEDGAENEDDDELPGGITEYRYNQREMDRLLEQAQAKRTTTGRSQPVSDNDAREEGDDKEEEYVPKLRTRAKVTASVLNHGVEMSIGELFDSLKNDSPKHPNYNKVTVKNIMEWHYMRMFIRRGQVTEELIRRLMRECGSPFGTVNKEQFEPFIEKLVHALAPVAKRDTNKNLDEDQPEELEWSTADDDEDANEFIVARKADATRSTKNAERSHSPSAELSSHVADALSIVMPKATSVVASASAGENEELKGSESPAEIMNHLFRTVSRNKPAIGMQDIYDWEFVQSFIHSSTTEPPYSQVYNDMVSVKNNLNINSTISRVFYKLAGKHKCLRNGQQLHDFIDELCEERELELTKARSLTRTTNGKQSQQQNLKPSEKPEMSEAVAEYPADSKDLDKDVLHDRFDPDQMRYGGSSGDQEQLKSQFDILAEGRTTMTLQQLEIWELPQLLMSEVPIMLPTNYNCLYYV
jgi:predicted RNA-binding protein with RPS1 domain